MHTIYSKFLTPASKPFILLLAIVLTFSCKTKEQEELEDALAFSGKNRIELEKVLDYYKSPKDSLKLKAAKFLIINMPGHFGYYGSEINTYANVFSLIDTLSYIQEKLSNEDKKVIGDSIVARYGWPQIDKTQKEYDIKILSANYLISNIEYAFKAWKETLWSNKVPFVDFCEYILPYRVKEERAEFWRPAFYNTYSQIASSTSKPADAKAVFDNMNWTLNTETNFNVFFGKYYPFDQSISDVVKGKIGSCEITSFFATSAMRAAGLPVAYDYIMHWGSTNSRHYMPHLVGRFDSLHLITNENVQEDTWHLVDFSSEFNNNRHKFTQSEMPEGLYIQNVRTIPKVYRYTYSQSSFFSYINKNVPKEYISPEFLQTNLKDVTSEYVTTADVTIPVTNDFTKCQLAYLTVFDIQGWQPVAVTKIVNGKAEFKNMGKKTMYLPTVYHDGKHWPAGAPFYIDSANNIHKVIAENKKMKMRLLRKYPLYTYSAYHSEILKGGRFEGANDSTFSNPTLLYQINNYPFFVNEVACNNKKKFRYLRYVAPADANFEPDNIAEVQFLDSNSKPIEGRFIGIEGIPGHEINKAFDNDLNTYYQNSRNRDGWIGIDLGENNGKTVKSIKFCPRNDTNGIIPENSYELFYWDGNDWISLGTKSSDKYILDYANVPVNALFWLKCNNGGHEERIFTYENGTQIWW